MPICNTLNVLESDASGMALINFASERLERTTNGRKISIAQNKIVNSCISQNLSNKK